MLIRTDTLLPWDYKDRLNGILYPKNIEKLWTDTELLEIGLVHEIKAILPEGFRWVGDPSWDITGQEFRTSELIPPPTPEEIAAEKAAGIDNVFNDAAITKLLYHLGQEQGMFNGLDGMRAWVDAKEDPPATGGGGPP